MIGAAPTGTAPLTELSPELARDWGLLAGPNEQSMRRRLGWIWGTLILRCPDLFEGLNKSDSHSVTNG